MVKLTVNFYAFQQETKERFLDLVLIPWQKLLMAVNLAAVFLILTAALMIMRQSTQNLLILHYNVATGVDFIGGESNLAVFPAISFLFFVLNTALSLIVKKERKFAGYFLQAGCLACNAILLLSLALIYVVNFR
jgi:hypothetical protein